MVGVLIPMTDPNYPLGVTDEDISRLCISEDEEGYYDEEE